MKLCIFGSVTLLDRIQKLGDELTAAGHQVMLPTTDENAASWGDVAIEEKVARKRAFIEADLADLKTADAVLIANFPRHGVGGYVGAHTLMEAAFAHAMGKEVVFLHEIGPQPCRLEAMAIQDRCLGGDLSQL